MSRITRRAAALAIAATAVTGAGIATSGPAEAATSYGCPSGYVCFYSSYAKAVAGQPYRKYYYCRTYNLSGEYGKKWVLNNQTGGATVRYYRGYNATGSWFSQGYGWKIVDITPINSIRLVC